LQPAFIANIAASCRASRRAIVIAFAWRRGRRGVSTISSKPCATPTVPASNDAFPSAVA
jgi:hypothetical protein